MTHQLFHRVATAVICVNSGLLVAAWADSAHAELWDHIETCCWVFFVVELLVRIRGEGRGFFRSKWNVFDLAVIILAAPVTALSDNVGFLRLARVARLARLMHLGRHISHLRLVYLVHSYAGFYLTDVQPWGTVKHLVRR